MKYTLLTIVVVMTVAGCAQGEVVVKNSAQEYTQVEEDASAFDPRITGVQAVDFTETSQETSVDNPLVITERFVDWGFTAASRSGADIDTVIIHSVYNPFVQKEEYDLDEILSIFEGYGVAPHYIISRDGQIHYVVQEKDVAYHAGRSRVPDGRTNVNDFSLGIEMINSLDDEYTDEQYGALRMLLEQISERYAIQYVLGHDEIEVEDPWNFDWSHINDLRHEARVDV